MTQADITIRASRGNGKGGKSYYYIRPVAECHNRSRKAKGFSAAEIQESIDKIIAKWFAPHVVLYEIDGIIIGSNNKENALKEYWRICEREKENVHFEVKQLP